MLTIKLPFETSEENCKTIRELCRQFSPIVRYSYERLKEGKSGSQVNSLIKQKFGKVDSWFVSSCLLEAKGMAEKDGEKGRIFGGKSNFEKRKAGKITNEQWKQLRIQPLSVIGEASKKGNRKFNFDIENNKLVFKVNKKQHIEITLPKLKKTLKRVMRKLQESCKECLAPISFRISESYIWIIYDEKKLASPIYSGKAGRTCAIDLNPEYIGCVILDGNQVVKSKLFNFKQLTNSSSNKLKHELSQTAKSLISFAKSHNCSSFAIEQLNIKNKNHGKGKKFNKLINNKWNRNYLINQLVKRTNIEGIGLTLVNPAYSSIIGNLVHQLPDAISAAIEIGRRSRKGAPFYPVVISEDILANRWKEAQGWSYNNWKELTSCLKNSKVRYRVSMSNIVFEPFMSNASKVLVNNESYSQRWI